MKVVSGNPGRELDSVTGSFRNRFVIIGKALYHHTMNLQLKTPRVGMGQNKTNAIVTGDNWNEGEAEGNWNEGGYVDAGGYGENVPESHPDVGSAGNDGGCRK